LIYGILRLLFGLATRAFFKDITLENFDRIPAQGPVLLLPNHPNGLVDPFLILIHLKRPVSLTAKHTLKKNPLLRLLFKLGGVLALQRRQDGTEGPGPPKNAEALAEARRRLAVGGAVCLFPEGISHNQPQIQPLKTGAARIALEFVDLDANPGGLKVVPIGIDYSDKQGFRSSAVLRVAEPIDAGAWRAAHPRADAKAFMADVEARLRENTLNFEKRKESVIISFAAELLLTRGAEPPRVSQPARAAREWLGKIEEIQGAYEAARTVHGRELEALGGRIQGYRARLRRLGILPGEVYIDVSLAGALLFSLREFGALLLGLPVAAWGMLNFFLPYMFCVGIKNLLGRERDVRATYAIFSAVLAFPLYILVLAALLFYGLPWPWALAWIASLPLSGWATLRYRDRFLAVIRRSLTFLVFVVWPGLKLSLISESDLILKEIQELHKSLEVGASSMEPLAS
jgi:glycerol-3-phosphate O-acyltransferase/dihydroxyacetone phosphate acyltransferase